MKPATVISDQGVQALVVAKRKEMIKVNLGTIEVYIPNPQEIHTEVERTIVVAQDALEQAERALVESKVEYAAAGDLIKSIRGQTKTATEYRRSIVDPINKFVKFFNALFKDSETMRAQATSNLDTKIQAWSDAQRAQERADEAARQRIIEEEALRRAEAATEAVDQDAIIEVAAEVIEDVVHRGPKSLARGEYGSTTSASTVVAGEVSSVTLLCQAVADGRAPQALVSFSKAQLNALAQKLHGRKQTLDGLEIIVQEKVIVR